MRIKCLKPQVRMLSAPTVKPIQATQRTRGSAWVATRARILKRDNHLCVVCSASGHVSLAREVDHRVPLHEGGKDEDSNLQSICVPCHEAKTAAEAKRRAGKQ